MKQSQMLLASLALLLLAATMFRAGGAMLLGFSRLLIPIIVIGAAYYFIKNTWKNLQSGPEGRKVPPSPTAQHAGEILDICAKCGQLKAKCRC